MFGLQAIPVIMGGRDCIGVAKTGSGKVLRMHSMQFLTKACASLL